jgi:hypothetical protein
MLEAAKFIPADSLGTTDNCGFSPFADDTSTSESAFATVKSRVEGTAMAENYRRLEMERRGRTFLSAENFYAARQVTASP